VIFVTVGHQMPFDRLIGAVDQWALARGRADLFAQIGEGEYLPQWIAWAKFMPPEEFDRRVREATAIVGHAGTGTIIAGLRLGKPVLVLPRRSALGETRNDHQFATARHFEKGGQIVVAWSEEEVPAALDRIESFHPQRRLADVADPALTERLRAFIWAA